MRAAIAEGKASGVEWLVYKILGSDLMGSIAFAVDPLSRFKTSAHKITQVNRSQQFKSSPTISTRKRYRKSVTVSCSDHEHGLDGWSDYYCDNPTNSESTVSLTQQTSITTTLNDTTRRTRGVDSDQGEFEIFSPFVSSPPRHRSWVSSTNEVVEDWPTIKRIRLTSSRICSITPSAARISSSSIESMLTSERSLATAAINKHGYSLLKDCFPESREFSLAYYIAELKDLPRTIRGTLELLVDSRKKLRGLPRSQRTAGEAYLNGVFGWSPLYRDIVRMLRTPERVTRRVNRLMAQEGKAATFRSSFKWTEPWSSPPSFTYDRFTLDTETQESIGTVAYRDCELRCITNFGVQLPSVALPKLREKYYHTKLWGIDPSPEDVYNIVPWTWLIDWFTGIGEYVGIYDMLNNDDSLANWAFFVYQSEARLTTTFTGGVLQSHSREGELQLPQTKLLQTHSSTAGYKYIKRVSVGNTGGLKYTSQPESLTDDQAAILTALFLQKGR